MQIVTFIIYCKLIIYYLFRANVGIAKNIASNLFPIKYNNKIYYLPYSSNIDYENNKDSKKNVIIAIHGLLKNSKDLCETISRDMKKTSHLNNTIVICPQFLNSADLSHNKSNKNILTWPIEGWDQGDQSSNYNAKISSFAALDSLVKYYSEKRQFKNIKKIIIIGFSAGGQFVQRYSFFTMIDSYEKSKNITVTYIPLSPSSYLYLNNKRPRGIPGIFIRPDGYIDNFCKKYNSYKYGLENIPDRNVYHNINNLISNYKYKNIYYIVGKNDNKTLDFFLDRKCAAKIQGTDRYNRLTNYFGFLVNFYGNNLKIKQSIHFIDNAGHNMEQIVASNEFIAILNKVVSGSSSDNKFLP